MIVQDKYIVVEKIVLGTDMYLAQHYIDEYQTCKVVKAPEGSIYEKGTTLLVGNRICFDKAVDFGSESYYIDASEVFGVLKDGVITPSKSYVYIEADKYSKETVDHDGLELYNDISYNPLATENVTQHGVVLTSCVTAYHSVFGNELNVEVEPGDKVYTHHFLTDTDNEREFNGKKYYEMLYENLYCKISKGSIVMLNEWNFVTPVETKAEEHGFGIISKMHAGNELRVGVINHTSKSLRERGINSGDKVYFKRKREYKIDVEGDTYYRIETNDILCKYENMEALGEIIIVKPIKRDNMVGGILTTLDNNPIPDKGEVLSVGSECGESLKSGDIILFRKMASTEVDTEQGRVLLMNYKSAYAKV